MHTDFHTTSLLQALTTYQKYAQNIGDYFSTSDFNLQSLWDFTARQSISPIPIMIIAFAGFAVVVAGVAAAIQEEDERRRSASSSVRLLCNFCPG